MAAATPPHPNATPLGIESVAFATGTGRLVRRATAVLFDPSGANPKLSSVFDDASDDHTAIAHVLRTVVEADLDVAPFAIVSWADDLDLLVFGDIDVHTSCPSAPMISGARSATWVAHRVDRDLLDAAPSPQVWCGEPAEPGTNLRLGIATCGGFRLDLIVDSGVPELHTTEPLAPAAPSPSPAAVPRPVTVETEAVETEAVETKAVAATPEPRPPVFAEEPAPLPGDHTPALLSFDEPAPEPATTPEPEIRVWTESSADGDAEPDGHDNGGDADDTDADPFALPANDDDVDQAPAPVASPTAELLEFDIASESSPPQPVAPPSPAVETAEQNAPLALLIFDDRADLSILGTSVLGRRPQPDAEQLAVAIDHPEVSRTHAEIDTGEGRGQVATIRDLGSRNGTWVQSPGGAGLRRLDADERALLLPGTIVHLGSVEVCFTWQPIDE